MEYAFDLDGTLAHTKEAVRDAYIKAGVVPPDDFFGKPWREWLNDPEIHERKNRLYVESIEKGFIQPTLIAVLFRELMGRNTRPFIMTGASRAATSAIVSYLRIVPWNIYYELTTDQKIDLLNSRTEPGVAFEDDIRVVNRIREETKWTVCHVLY